MSRNSKLGSGVTWVVLGVIGAGLGACARDGQWRRFSFQEDRPVGLARYGEGAANVDELTADWPSASRKAAREMVEKYGSPDGVTPDRLVWKDREPWVEIIVSREEVPHRFPMQHTDVLEQAIHYPVSPGQFDELAAFDGSVIVERTKGTMSARCDKEAMNYLALNLAHDIVTGKRSVEGARDFYAERARAFKKGETHPYTQGLVFPLPGRGVGDPDQPAP